MLYSIGSWTMPSSQLNFQVKYSIFLLHLNSSVYTSCARSVTLCYELAGNAACEGNVHDTHSPATLRIESMFTLACADVHLVDLSVSLGLGEENVIFINPIFLKSLCHQSLDIDFTSIFSLYLVGLALNKVDKWDKRTQ